MKKRKNNKKIPSYAFGLNEGINVGGMLMDTAGSIISGNSDTRSKGSVAGSTLKGLGTGAAMGASIGSVIPGIGTAIGGAVGAVAGTIGGLVTGKKKRREAIERANRQATLEKTRNGLNQSAIAESEYWDNMTPAYTFENGGIMPDLAYVDNNEILRDDYGNIIKVPNTKPGTDNHLIDATTLDSVLSDKIKRPGTNTTFAKEGKKLVNMTKPSKGKDIFAENTNKLNKMNANKAYEKLLAEQEMTKTKRGIKSKVKGIPAYEDGTNTNKGDSFFDLLKWMYDYYLVEPWERHTSSNTAQNNTTTDNASSSSRSTDGAKTSYYAPFNSKADGGRIMLQQNIAGMGMPFFGFTQRTEPVVNDNTVDGVTSAAAVNPRIPLIDATNEDIELSPLNVPTTPSTPTTRKTKTTKTTKPQSAPFQMPTLDLPEVPTPTLKGPEGRLLDYYPTTRKTREGVKLGEFPDLLPLTPVLYNFAQSLRDAEVDPLVTNPYAGAITSNMARRRMNIEPMRNANRRTRAISNYNLANMNANTGVNLAARTQAAANEYAANADLYAQKQNADNSYLAEYSQMLNNLGQQFVEANNLYNENNARNRARSRDFGSAAASQLGKWAQVNRQERNSRNRDKILLPYLADFLKRGYTEDMVNRTLNLQ